MARTRGSRVEIITDPSTKLSGELKVGAASIPLALPAST